MFCIIDKFEDRDLILFNFAFPVVVKIKYYTY